jgi:hypothetical protein
MHCRENFYAARARRPLSFLLRPSGKLSCAANILVDSTPWIDAYPLIGSKKRAVGYGVGISKISLPKRL